jgi:hypothetical protein
MIGRLAVPAGVDVIVGLHGDEGGQLGELLLPVLLVHVAGFGNFSG